MPVTTADVVICGAGIAGVSTAYHLARLQPGLRILLIDERPPLSLTSDKSTECYRNWWPEAAMIQLIDRSVEWFERWAGETGNAFGLNRRGYLYASTTDAGAQALLERAQAIAHLGAGALQIEARADPRRPESKPALEEEPPVRGAEYCADSSEIQRRYPYLSPETRAVLHVRRAGWLRAHELGTWLLQQAELTGVTRISGRLTKVDATGGALRSVGVEIAEGSRRIAAPILVNAAGPFAGQVSELAGVGLPLAWELHLKAAFRDQDRIVPRQAPLVILADEQHLAWSEEEQSLLGQSPDDRYLLGRLPAGAHLRPEGPTASPYCLLLWPYHLPPVQPVFPIAPDPAYAEIAMRGMSRLIPALRAYVERMPPTTVDGGYYTRTPDNLPLIGPTPLAGYYLMAALSGFGVMASPAAGELLAQAVLGQGLPPHARPFLLERFESAEYREQLRRERETGEL